MDPELLQYWAPFACVLAASGILWSMSAPVADLTKEETAVKLRLPVAAKDYEPPADLRNPFFRVQPPPPPAEPAKGKDKTPSTPRVAAPLVLRLDGILWDSSRPMASLNGRLLGRGERMGEVVVLDILPDRVILNVNGNRTEKRIEQDAARKRARRAPPPAPAGESKQ